MVEFSTAAYPPCMESSPPPVTCHYCRDPLDLGASLTLAIRRQEQEGVVLSEDVAGFHPPCWEAFRREHGLG
jgi:hypothetical protein